MIWIALAFGLFSGFCIGGRYRKCNHQWDRENIYGDRINQEGCRCIKTCRACGEVRREMQLHEVMKP